MESRGNKAHNAPGCGAGGGGFGRPRILFAPEGDGGGGGGVPPAAGGSGQIDQQVINTINSAVTAQLNRAIEKLPLQQLISQGIANALPTALEGMTAKLSDTLGAQISKLAPQGGGEQEPKAGKGKAEQPNEALIKLQTQLDALTGQMADKDRQLAAQAAEQADAKMLDGARSAFAKAGVKEPMIDAVIALHKTRGTFKSDKDGPHVVATRKSSHGQYTERLDLEKFAAEWAGSDEGKHYIPAAGAQRRQQPGGTRDMLSGAGQQRPAPGGGGEQRSRQENQQASAEEARSIGDALIDHINS